MNHGKNGSVNTCLFPFKPKIKSNIVANTSCFTEYQPFNLPRSQAFDMTSFTLRCFILALMLAVSLAILLPCKNFSCKYLENNRFDRTRRFEEGHRGQPEDTLRCTNLDYTVENTHLKYDTSLESVLGWVCLPADS